MTNEELIERHIRPMSEARTTGLPSWVALWYRDGLNLYPVAAHYADTDCDGLAPPAKGWFRWTGCKGGGFYEAPADPIGWTPLEEIDRLSQPTSGLDTNTNEAVERVARALFNDDEQWERFPAAYKANHYEKARRAIAALASNIPEGGEIEAVARSLDGYAKSWENRHTDISNDFRKAAMWLRQFAATPKGTPDNSPDLVMEDYEYLSGEAKRLGYLGILEALEDLARLQTASNGPVIADNSDPVDTKDEDGWLPIESAPEGNEEEGPFFDVLWAGEQHLYLPVPMREIDCYCERGAIKRKHGYPSVTTVFRRPTHFRPLPAPPRTSPQYRSASTPEGDRP